MRHLFALLLCLLPTHVVADISGPVRVVDGDTLWVGETKVRLHGIDTPERWQTCRTDEGADYGCGERATFELMRLIGDHPVRCDDLGPGGYDRVAGRCFAGGQDLQRAMVAGGFALAYAEYSTAYVAEERAARVAKTGFWAMEMQDPAEARRDRRAAPPQQVPADCAIKGNISDNGRIYHSPGQDWYDRTRIDQSRGERWFCSAQEAEAAGWRAARN